MPKDTSITPEFGPNGAVMNAPTMTPDMRAKIDQTAKPPTLADVGATVGMIVSFVALLAAFYFYGGAARQFLIASPWWAGALTGVLSVLVAVYLWGSCRDAYRRWELARSGGCVLITPWWARMAFATSDVGIAVSWSVFVVGGIADLEDNYRNVRDLALLTLVGFALFGWFMRWLADQRKWTWRQQA